MGASLTGTTLIKSLLLGSAAGIVAVTFAQAADLPTRKAAPVDYVKVCNVGGITGWTLPGSDTCLKFSGFVTAQFAGGNLNTQYNWAGSPIYSTITGVTLPAAISGCRDTKAPGCGEQRPAEHDLLPGNDRLVDARELRFRHGLEHRLRAAHWPF